MPLAFARTRAEMELAPALPGRLRALVRAGALSALGTTLGAFRKPAPSTLRIAVYHAVFEDEVAGFEEHLRYFKSAFQVLPLSRALEVVASGHGFPPTLAITFDDG